MYISFPPCTVPTTTILGYLDNSVQMKVYLPLKLPVLETFCYTVRNWSVAGTMSGCSERVLNLVLLDIRDSGIQCASVPWIWDVASLPEDLQARACLFTLPNLLINFNAHFETVLSKINKLFERVSNHFRGLGFKDRIFLYAESRNVCNTENNMRLLYRTRDQDCWSCS